MHEKGTRLGQPTYLTHPHLLKEGELVAGVTATEFLERRQRFITSIRKAAGDRKSNGVNIVVIPSASKQYMSEKIPYVFRQNSDFVYLTGCLEPDAALLLWIDQKDVYKSVLFVQPKNQHSELRDGPRTGVLTAPDFFLVDEAYTMDDFKTFFE